MRIGLDLDGTILDSRPRHKLALEEACERLSVELPAGLSENYVSEKSDGYTGLDVLRKYNVRQAEQVSAYWMGIIENPSMLSQDKLYPDVKLILDKLYMGNVLYLVTARRYNDRVLDQIHKASIGTCFKDIIIVSNDNYKNVGVRKGMATQSYNLSLVIGDTESDCEWADYVGAEFRPVTSGFRSEAYWAARNIKAYSR
ncbi:MAG: HAD hydrolase-like protein, partial [Candidatus Pacearchaeota archaeon]|nr:HAD hydrolase-like protein [Candidatus Pacearchaeota archaeon]